ncbi:MAG: hypothetical protein M1816_001243 [Peltula sp. TS41687]|nr:MAG: hypothetical protein M1816_001243 [Peltula sp. TS41687]
MSYVNEKSVLAIGIIFPVLGLVAVALRFAVRSQRKVSFGVDDWLCLPAVALVVGAGIIMIIGSATHTIGTHSPDIGLEIFTYEGKEQILQEKLSTALDLVQIAALGFIKLSILFLYRRIFRGRVFEITSRIAIGFTIAWTVAFLVAYLSACGTNFWAYYSSLAALQENCVDTFKLMLTLAVTDVMVDLFILGIPIPFVFALQLPLQRKIAVCAILMLGTLATACGITRMAIFAEFLSPALFAKGTILGVSTADPMGLGVVSLLEFWGMLEVGVAMVACCLPTLRPLFQGFSPESVLLNIRNALSLRSTSSRGSSKRYQTAESKTSIAASDSQTPVYIGQYPPVDMASGTPHRKGPDGEKLFHSVEIV